MEITHQNLLHKVKQLPIHTFQYRNRYFAFDISTSSSFEIDQVYYDIFNEIGAPSSGASESFYKRYSEAQVDKFLAELNGFIEKGYFTDKPSDIKQNSVIRNIELNIIHSCNMNCLYCYGDGGIYGTEEGLMEVEVAKNAIKFLAKESGDEEVLGITYFGGEPLMNFNLIQEVTLYAEQYLADLGKTPKFNLTTNATLLDQQKLNFLNEHKIGILVSMDGDKEVQDYLRPFKNGEGSYDSMVENIKALTSSRDHVFARTTLTKANTDILKTISTFKQLNFRGCHFAVVDTDINSLKLDDEDFSDIKKQYEMILDEMLLEIAVNNEPNFVVGDLNNNIRMLYNTVMISSPCGAGRTMICVSPKGGIYPCHRFAGNEEYALGNIYDGINSEKRNIFLKPVIKNDNHCSECWIRYLCAGNCWYSRLDRVSNTLLNNCPNENVCNHLRSLFEMSLVLYNDIMDKPNHDYEEKMETKC